MTKLLTFADKIHKTIQQKLSTFDCIDVDDIFDLIPKPLNLKMKRFYGHTLSESMSDFVPAVDDIIHLNSIHELLNDGTSAIITCNGHNVAIYCNNTNQNDDTSIFIFDSLPACIYYMNFNDLQTCLKQIFGIISEFNLFLIVR